MDSTSLIQRIWLKLGHRAQLAVIIASLGGMILTFFGFGQSPWQISSWIIGALGIGLAASAFWHDIHLCIHCATELPLNGAELAEQHRRTLHHRHQMLPKSLRDLAVKAVIVLVPILILDHFAPDGLIKAIINAPISIICAYILYCLITHRRLQLWCPWCRHNGGGNDQAPEPTPTAPLGRTV